MPRRLHLQITQEVGAGNEPRGHRHAVDGRPVRHVGAEPFQPVVPTELPAQSAMAEALLVAVADVAQRKRPVVGHVVFSVCLPAPVSGLSLLIVAIGLTVISLPLRR